MKNKIVLLVGLIAASGVSARLGSDREDKALQNFDEFERELPAFIKKNEDAKDPDSGRQGILDRVRSGGGRSSSRGGGDGARGGRTSRTGGSRGGGSRVSGSRGDGGSRGGGSRGGEKEPATGPNDGKKNKIAVTGNVSALGGENQDNKPNPVTPATPPATTGENSVSGKIPPAAAPKPANAAKPTDSQQQKDDSSKPIDMGNDMRFPITVEGKGSNEPPPLADELPAFFIDPPPPDIISFSLGAMGSPPTLPFICAKTFAQASLDCADDKLDLCRYDRVKTEGGKVTDELYITNPGKCIKRCDPSNNLNGGLCAHDEVCYPDIRGCAIGTFDERVDKILPKGYKLKDWDGYYGDRR
mmetsp:Transcript_1215/g.1768  ORF Transcript_1215/g.1768 Transcript_1215/m.1768 type:complete len:357 (-) Transcript_1215:138-1208(-)|eukprot:CAMPEP_0118696388 /NCGR_PEP_ID=MMETSP0800-20121206/13814_1 /TAXON_ID=210618 ORGANISM="Striatella unipunctata, Strain CCMP2910" /NCGR_SAMPLE_ID=MMETSP0800 /ASSEMBLY_ACC=CAM_ASM_000638 /LENGTH=356 /DNA_ID=CAMNT_0006595485 /DNA_START=73 /DNA_END=1143 /DNA_ORIENTATION=-